MPIHSSNEASPMQVLVKNVTQKKVAVRPLLRWVLIRVGDKLSGKACEIKNCLHEIITKEMIFLTGVLVGNINETVE